MRVTAFKINWLSMAWTSAVACWLILFGVRNDGGAATGALTLGALIAACNASLFPVVWYGRRLERRLAHLQAES